MKKEKNADKTLVTSRIHYKHPHLHISEDPQDIAVVLVVLAMTLYYIWRMFYITPSYEELHDYFFFISKGPLYTITNWSLEGNHIGYNFLASLLNEAGIPKYIVMRGISCVAATSNLILLYRLSKRYFTHWIPFATIVTYSGFELVNILNIQGRGYTISVTLFLLSIYMLGRLTLTESFSNIQYIFLVSIFISALYIHLWNINWIIPMCLSVFLYLLINGLRTRKVSGTVKNNIYLLQLFNILICEIVAFLVAAILYIINILGSGAGSLSTDNRFAGLSRLEIVSKDPVRAFLEGLRILKEPFGMIEPEGNTYIVRWYHFIYEFSEGFAPGFAHILMVICFVSIFVMIAGCVMFFEESRTCIRLIILGQLFWMPFVLTFCKKVPSYESYMFMGVIMAMAVSFVVNNFIITIKSLDFSPVTYGLPVIMAVVYFFIGVFGKTFFAPYNKGIDETYQALIAIDPTSYNNPQVTDIIQKYLMEFLYDCDSRMVDSLEKAKDADYLLIQRQTYEDASASLLDNLKGMHRAYENGSYIIFTK